MEGDFHARGRQDFSVMNVYAGIKVELKYGDGGGGADALNRRHAPQGRQTIRRKRAQGTPRALELVDLGDQAQDLRGDLDSVGSDHETNTTPNNTHHP